MYEDDINSGQCSPGVGVVHQAAAHDWLVVAVAVHLVAHGEVHIGLSVHGMVTLLQGYNQYPSSASGENGTNLGKSKLFGFAMLYF